MLLKLGLIGAYAVVLLAGAATGRNVAVLATEAEFEAWHTEYNTQASQQISKKVFADWAQNTNIKPETTAAMIAAAKELAAWSKQQSLDMKARFAGTTLTSPRNRRLYRKLSKVGDAALPADKFETLANLKARMEEIYSTAKFCEDPSKTLANCEPDSKILTLDDTTELLSTGRDYDKLLHLWKSWRDVSGKLFREDYQQYIDLKNEGAVADGYANTAEAWRAPYVEPTEEYTDANFMAEIDAIWTTLQPLYEQLHAYVRAKLVKKYDKNPTNPAGPIPAHLLGNMWAQTWLGVQDFTIPYPGKGSLDVTAKMKELGWNHDTMFKISDKFFKDLGLIEMPPKFWVDSLFEKPTDREVVCHASAWDFYNGEDFRVKQCTVVTMEDLFTVHHEMGHVEYFLQYKDLPVTFRDGANDGFHEAIGDTLTLSVSTPGHLKKIGLLDNYEPDTQLDLNFMFTTALEKIAFLPFGLAMDLYRYDVFSGKIKKDELNKKWWEYVLKYQGLCSPVTRSENDFDPGSKFHIPADVPYMRYFVSFIIQFQFHKAMCEKAGHTGPLYTCDIDGSEEAGAVMAEALKLGSSESWQTAMEKLTGQKKMDAQPLLDFFAPLLEFLKAENEKNKSPIGWTNDVRCNNDPAFSDYVHNVYNPRAEEVIFKSVEASWNYNTDLTDANLQLMVAAATEAAEFDKATALKVKEDFSPEDLSDPTLIRLYDKITKLGDAGLAEADFKELQLVGARMTDIYSKAKICKNPAITKIADCPAAEILSLDPHLTDLLASSRDQYLLEHIWKAWRDATGKNMKTDYTTYVKLKNKAAEIDGFKNSGEAWRYPYVEPTIPYADGDFTKDIKAIWEQVRPLYEDLHAFIRFQLKKKYPTANIVDNGPIPAHLLGNMWAQTWSNLIDFTRPYPDEPSLDVTAEMVKQGYNPVKMFQISDQFFTDLGLKPMPQEFWEKSMLEKPANKEVTCHASAWDFYNRKDFRVKQCTTVTMDQLLTVHHEMGHVEYYLQYKDLPVPFRRGANDGFHEAIGDTLALSVATPKHLKDIGLVIGDVGGEKSDINFLFATALDKIAFLPFGLMMDLYRYDIFEGKTTEANYNQKWWEYSLEYQGVCSPVARTENDFDAGAKYHIPADTPYMRYFVSFIIQFQFHKAMCDASGHTGPLHTCDFAKSKAAGEIMAATLSLGSSEPWQVAMKKMTGTDKIDATALLQFFQPVRTWIRDQNTANKVTTGWIKGGSSTCIQPPRPTTGTASALGLSLLGTVALTFVTFLFTSSTQV